jgi:hypothetical protein
MFPGVMKWAAADTGFVAIILFTIIGVIVCSIVFPQDGSGGDFDFDCGRD